MIRVKEFVTFSTSVQDSRSLLIEFFATYLSNEDDESTLETRSVTKRVIRYVTANSNSGKL